MEASKESKPRRKKKLRIKVFVSLSVCIFIVLLVFLLLVPAFISSGQGRSLILSKVNDSIDGTADFADLSMGWFKGVRLTDLTFADGFGRIALQARQIDAKPHYASILMGTMSFGETIVHDPTVKIDLSVPHIPKAGRAHRYVLAGQAVAPAALPIERIDLTVKNGTVGVTDSDGKAVRLSQIESHVNLKPAGKQTDFDLNTVIVDGAKQAKVEANGQVIPQKKTGWTFQGTTGRLKVKVSDLELESLGPLFELAGIDVEAKGSVSADIEGAVKDGQIQDLKGDISGRDLDVTAEPLGGDRITSSTLDVAVKLHREQDLISIDKLVIDGEWLDTEITGAVPTTLGSMLQFLAPGTSHNLNATFECDLPAVLSQLANTVGLKEGLSVTGGRVSGAVLTQTKDGAKELQGSANLVGLAGTLDGKAITLSQPVKGEIGFVSDEAGLNFRNLNLSSSFATVECTGRDKLVDYDARADMALLQTELGQFVDMGPYSLTGALSSKGQVSIATERMDVVGSARIENSVVSGPNGLTAAEPKADASFSVGYVPEIGMLDVNRVSVNASAGQIVLHDSMVPVNNQPSGLLLSASVSQVNLALLRSFVALVSPSLTDMALEGIAEADLSISSKQNILNVFTDSAAINDFKLSMPGRTPFEQEKVRFNFDGDVNRRDGNWIIRKLQLIGDGVEIDFSAEQTVEGPNTVVQGSGQIDYDWAAVSNIASDFIPAGLVLQGRQSDEVTFSSTFGTGREDQLFENLSATAAVGFEQGNFMGLEFSETQVPVAVEDRLLTISPFTAKVNNGKLSFAGQADFKQEPAVLRVQGPVHIAEDIEINDQTTSELLTYVNPLFAGSVNVLGKVDFDCEKLVMPMASGQANLIELVGTIAVSDGQLETRGLLGTLVSLMGDGGSVQSLAIRPTLFTVSEGKVQYDDMQVEIGQKPINFGGVIGLDGALDMTVTLPYTLKGGTTRVDNEATGTRVSLPLTGTISKPILDTDRLLQDAVIKSGLELLEGLFKK